MELAYCWFISHLLYVNNLWSKKNKNLWVGQENVLCIEQQA